MATVYKAWIFNWKAGTFVDQVFFWSEESAQAWLFGRVTDEMLSSQEYEWGIDRHTVYGSSPTMEGN